MIQAAKKAGSIFVVALLLATNNFLFLPILITALAPLSAEAATGIPAIISYQGRLTSSAGSPLGGASGTPYFFKFSIWDSATVGGGSKVWPAAAPNYTTSTVTDGVFTVEIGNTATGYPDALTEEFLDDTRFLQIEVSATAGGSYETLSPRQRITSAAYALNAQKVAGFVPSQSATASQVVVLDTNGNLELGGTNPQINATSSNALVLQGTGTGDIRFFNASNTIDSSGNATFDGAIVGASLSLGGGSLSFGNGTSTGALSVGGALSVVGVATLPSLLATNATTTNATSTYLYVSGDLSAALATITGLNATNSTTTNATTTNLAVTGSVALPASSIGANEIASSGVVAQTVGDASTALTLTVDADGRITNIATSTISSGGGADGNWVFFNGSGIRLATTSNQVLIGATSTSTDANLEVVGSADISGALNVQGQTTLTNTSSTNLSASGQLTVTGTSTLGTFLVFGGDTIDELVGTGLQVVGGDLQTTLGTSVDLSSEINGVLGITNGGTGTSTPASYGSVLVFTGTNYEGFTTSTLGINLQDLLGTLDISTQSNLAVTFPLVLTNDTLSIAFTTTTENTWSALNTFTDLIATNSTTTNATTTNLAVTGSVALPASSIGANEIASSGVVAQTVGDASTALTLTVDADGRITNIATSTISSGGGSTDLNWTYFNGTGVRLATSTGQVLIGSTTTSTLASLEVVGSISNKAPVTLTELGSRSLPSNSWGMEVVGRYAYVAVTGNDTLNIYDVSTTTPTLVGSVATDDSPYRVRVSGRYAYVVNGGTNDSFQVFDVANTATPVLVGRVLLTTLDQPRALKISGKYAYIGAGGGLAGLVIADISDPLNPKIISETTNGFNPHGIDVQGNYVFLTENNTNDIHIYDVSVPTAPRSVGAAGNGNSYGIIVSGKYAYVGDTAGVLIYDISTLSTPVLVGSIATQSTVVNSGDILQVAGKYLYVATDTATEEYLEVYDVSDPTAPILVSITPVGGGPLAVSVSGRRAYVTNFTTPVLAVYDLFGFDTNAATIGSLESGNLQVRNDFRVLGEAFVDGGLFVGPGGILTSGALTITGFASSTATSTIYDAALYLASSTPASTTNALYQQAGTLFWNGAQLSGLSQEGGSGETHFTTFSGNGVRLTTTTNQLLIGATSTSTDARLEVVGDFAVTATSTLATSTIQRLSVGTTTYPASTLYVAGDFTVTATSTFNGETTISDLILGPSIFETDSGIVSWIDMPVSSNAATSTKESYSAQIDGNPLLTIYGESNGFGGTQNLGVGIGTTTPSTLFEIATTTSILKATYDGSIVVGNPTSGAKGAGTINAQAVYDDNTLLTDYVFDYYFDGSVLSEDEELYGDYLGPVPLDQLSTYLEQNRHLPGFKGRDEWKQDGSFSLGYLASQVWRFAEEGSLYFTELHNRVSALEGGNTAILQGSSDSTIQLSPSAKITVENISVKGDLAVEGLATFGEDSAGQAKVLPGYTSVKVTFQRTYQTTPIITVTPVGYLGPIRYTVTSVDQKGFSIAINEMIPSGVSEILFNWIAVASSPVGKIFVSNGDPGKLPQIVVPTSTPPVITTPTSTPPVTTPTSTDPVVPPADPTSTPPPPEPITVSTATSTDDGS